MKKKFIINHSVVNRIAVGDNGVIYRSTDSGRDWSALGNYTSDNLVDLKYAGANTF